MQYNNMYYNNNYIPYTNMYHNTAPIYPNIETKPVEDITMVDDAHDESSNIDNDKAQEFTKEPLKSNKDRFTLFGFSPSLDDIIIIGLLIFLFLENKRDYLLLIILVLMLFDISIDTFKNMNILKHLFNPS